MSKADNLTPIREPNVYKMCEFERLTAPTAFPMCYRDSLWCSWHYSIQTGKRYQRLVGGMYLHQGNADGGSKLLRSFDINLSSYMA
jgi:hypothetical protein